MNEDFNFKASEKFKKDLQRAKNHQLHREEGYTSGDEYTEDNVGSGQFEYRSAPDLDRGQSKEKNSVKPMGERGVPGGKQEEITIIDKGGSEAIDKTEKSNSGKPVSPENHAEVQDRKQDSFDEDYGIVRPEEEEESLEAADNAQANSKESKRGEFDEDYGVFRPEAVKENSEEKNKKEESGDKTENEFVQQEKSNDQKTEANNEEFDWRKSERELEDKKIEQNQEAFVEEGKESVKTNLEELRNQMEKSFESYKDQEAQVERMRQDMSKFSRAGSFLGIGKNKEGSVNKDYRDKKSVRDEFKKKYRENLQAYYDELARIKKEEITEEGLSKNSPEFKDKIRNFVLTEKTIQESSGTDREDNQEQERESEKFTMLEYINKKEQEVLQSRNEMMDQKRKNALNKLWDWYRKLPKEKRIAYGAAMSASLGGLAGLAGGLGFSAALGYGAWRGVKSAGRRTAFAGAGAAMAKGADKAIGSKHQKKNETDWKKTEKEMVKGFSEGNGEIFKLLDEYNKKEKRRAKSKAAVVAFASGGLMVGAMGLDNFFPADDGGGVDIKNERTEKMAVNATDEDYPRESAPLENQQSKTVKQDIVSHIKQKEPGIAEAVDHSEKFQDNTSELLEKFNNQFKSDVENFSEVSQNDINEVSEQESENEKAADSTEETKETAEILADYSLAKGDTVWDKLEEYYDGNQNKVGNEILKFKKGLAENLVEDGVFDNKDQAQDYITWRFRHLEVGTQMNITEKGLDIPGFADSERVDTFKEDELGIKTEEDSAVASAEEQSEAETEKGSDTAEGSGPEEPEDTPEESGGEEDDLTRLLDKMEIDTNSEAWQTAKDLTVEDLLNNFPPDVGIEEIRENMPQNSTAQDAEKLREISRTVDLYGPSQYDQNLLVSKFLEENYNG